MSITKDYTWPVSAFAKAEYDFFLQEISKQKENMINKLLYIFGAGIRGCMFLKFFKTIGMEIAGFIDNNEKKCVGGGIEQYSILSLEEVLRNNNSKIFIVISVENGEGIVEQLEKANLKANKDFCHIGSYLYEKFEDRFFDKCQNHKIIMGDCILTQVAFDDISYKTLSELIEEKISHAKILGMHGMPMATFYHLLRLQIKLDMKPCKLILFVNIAMFDGKKDILPRAQHPLLLMNIQKRLPFKDEEFEKYVKLASDRFQKFNTDIFVKGKKQSDRRRNEQIQKMHFQMNYMYQLDKDNESLIYLQKIAQLTNENGIDLLLYIAPINYERGGELIGNGIIEKHQEHMKLIHSILQPYEYQICDAALELKKENFATQDTTNEVTNWEGRLKEVELLMKYDQERII